MRTILALLLSLVAVLPAAHAQEAVKAPVRQWLTELNRDIWIPFTEGVRTCQDAMYLDVHSKDYLRIQADSSFIMNYPQYVEDTVTMMGTYKAQGAVIAIEVRFEERIVNGEAAWEKGITRVVFTSGDGQSRTRYGRFQVVSRKEADGKWRMLTEYSPATRDATEEPYLRARATDDFTGFTCYLTFPEKKPRCDEGISPPARS